MLFTERKENACFHAHFSFLSVEELEIEFRVFEYL